MGSSSDVWTAPRTGARGALLLFAKAPRPGCVKTRMVPPWSQEQAAHFASCLLDDALEVSARAAAPLDLEVLLYVDPPDSLAEFESRLRGLRGPAAMEFCVRAQRGATLGERMGQALTEAGGGGASTRPLLLRGCDSPTLSEETLAEALEALDRVDLVLRPDADGGYSLVALRTAPADLFDHSMGHPEVLAETQARALSRGLTTELLKPGFDIDVEADLARLKRARELLSLDSCPRTLAFLDRERLWPSSGGP